MYFTFSTYLLVFMCFLFALMRDTNILLSNLQFLIVGQYIFLTAQLMTDDVSPETCIFFIINNELQHHHVVHQSHNYNKTKSSNIYSNSVGTLVNTSADTRKTDWPDLAVCDSPNDLSCPMLLFASCSPDNKWIYFTERPIICCLLLSRTNCMLHWK